MPFSNPIIVRKQISRQKNSQISIRMIYISIREHACTTKFEMSKSAIPVLFSSYKKKVHKNTIVLIATTLYAPTCNLSLCKMKQKKFGIENIILFPLSYSTPLNIL
jgi:hypothetical protein